MRRVPQVFTAAILAVATIQSAFAPAWAQSRPAVQDDKVTLNFVDADIPAVLRALSIFTHRNYLYDPRVKGKMTLVSDQPVDRATAMNMLAGSLRLQGYAIVEVDGVTRVVPEADAKLQGSAMSVESFGRGRAPSGRGASAATGGAGGGEVVTRVFPLKYENAANLVPVLRPMVPPNMPVNAYPGNNTVVVTDYADNMERIAQVIAGIDVPTSVDTAVVPVHYAIASDIAALATQLLDQQQQGGDPTQRITAVADPRTNSVVIRSSNPARTALARELVSKLDIQQNNSGNLHVVYLRNAQSVRLAQVLGGILSQQGPGSQQGGAQAPGPAAPRGGAAGASNGGGQSLGSLGGSLGGGNSLGGSGSAGAYGSTSAGLGNQQGIERTDTTNGMQPVTFSGNGAVVQADPTTNSLIISAPEPLYRTLREVIDQLDQRRAQVLVESLIVEVTETQAAQFGIQWMGATNGIGTSSNPSVIGGTNLNGTGINPNGATTIDVLPQGLNIGLLNGTTNIPGIGQILNLNVLANALVQHGGANVLSTPNLLTLDNEAASIMVGQTVPFVTGQYVTSGGGTSTNPFQTIEREDIGLKLNVRPQISEGGSIKLDIYQEVSSIDNAASNPTTGIVTNKRAIDTSVLIDDNQIIVLGGLLEDSVSSNSNGVPGLSSIPILGNLFKYSSRNRTKTNLMVFLRPHILRNANDSAGYTLDRYNYMRKVQSAVQPEHHWALPDMSAPILPPANVPTIPNGNPYDLRPQSAARTLQGPAPESTESIAVHQYPQSPQVLDGPVHANLPLGVSIATDPSALYASTDTRNTTLQFAQVEREETAQQIAAKVRMSGLNSYIQPGPGGEGYVVRADVARDSHSVDLAISLLKQLGYRPELTAGQ
jgi:general secretion pathway protein D